MVSQYDFTGVTAETNSISSGRTKTEKNTAQDNLLIVVIVVGVSVVNENSVIAITIAASFVAATVSRTGKRTCKKGGCRWKIFLRAGPRKVISSYIGPTQVTHTRGCIAYTPAWRDDQFQGEGGRGKRCRGGGGEGRDRQVSRKYKLTRRQVR
jgi:hypothetical protein